jgi:hypothetical protein
MLNLGSTRCAKFIIAPNSLVGSHKFSPLHSTKARVFTSCRFRLRFNASKSVLPARRDSDRAARARRFRARRVHIDTQDWRLLSRPHWSDFRALFAATTE